MTDESLSIDDYTCVYSILYDLCSVEILSARSITIISVEDW